MKKPHNLRALGPLYKKNLTIVRHNVRTKREQLGWTQAQLGEAVGVSQSTIAHIETACHTTRNPQVPLPLLCDIAEVFGVPLATLFIENAFGASTTKRAS